VRRHTVLGATIERSSVARSMMGRAATRTPCRGPSTNRYARTSRPRARARRVSPGACTQTRCWRLGASKPEKWLPTPLGLPRRASCSIGPIPVNQLVGNPFVSVSVDLLRGVARVTRSGQRSQSIEEITAAFDRAIGVLDTLDRPRLRLLIDLRAAPGRNDAEFESAMATRRSQLMRAFAAVAILVQTPIGELQVGRITREDGADSKVFSDEAKALIWLAEKNVTGRA
jgi:hypothetical protein